MDVQQVINNRYRILKKLGEGGMGSVMLVEDTHQNSAKLALKKVLSQKGKNSIIEILQHEFEVLSKLNHPNIALAYDYGIIQGTNENYFTTQYVEGVDLFRGTKEMQIEEIVDIIVQCCRGFDYVHSRGLIHQDIKPDNILLTFGSAEKEADQKGRLVKIIDFGLIDRENYTTGAVRGTPQFIAPEKLKGEPVDRRADLYSFGIVIFFILTRRLPFAAKSNKALILKHLYEDPPSPRKFREDIPEALEKIILKLMSKDPGDRFLNAADVIWAINESLSKNYPIDTDESVQSYILSGKFVGREKELTRLKEIFQVIYWMFEKKAFQEKEESLKSQANMLDAMMLGTSQEEKVQEDNTVQVDASEAPRMVLVGGESGGGKSRILREFKYYVQIKGVSFLELQASAGSSTSIMSVLLKMIVSFASAGTLDNPEYTEELSKFLPDKFSPSAEKTDDLNPAEARLRTMDRLSRLIQDVAENTSLVIYVDNLQWVDEMTLKTLAYLANLVHREAEQQKNSHILILGCYRENELKDSALEEFLGEKAERTYLEKVQLLPLKEDFMGELLVSMFGTPKIPKNFIQGLLEEARGNPLFLEEILKGLVEGKNIWRKGGTWEFPPSLDGIAIPQDIADILLSRILSLDALSQGILQVMSVFNKEITPDLLARYLGKDIRDILDIFKKLEQRQIVQKNILEDQAYYHFFQTKIQETLYKRIKPEMLQKLHQKAGETLEEYYGEEKNQYLAELAHHFLQAGDRTKGLDYGFRAAEQFKNTFSHAPAAALYERIVKLLGPEDIRRRTQTFLTMAGLYEFLGEYHLGIQKLQDVLSGPRLSKLIRVQLQRKIAHLYLRKREVPQALMIIEGAISELRNPAAPEMGICLGTRGQIYLKQGDIAKAQTDLDEALEILQTHNKEQELIGVWNGKGILELNMAAWENASESFTNCLQLCKKLENLQGQGAALSNLAFTNIEAGKFDLALKYIQGATPIFEKIGDQKAQILGKYNLSEIHYQKGEFPEGQKIAEEAFQISEDLEDPLLLSKTSFVLGSLDKVQGNFGPAEKRLERAIQQAEEAQDYRMLAQALTRKGELYTTLGMYPQAQDLIKKALEISKEKQYHFIFCQSTRAQGILSCRQKQRDMALRALETSLKTSKDRGMTLEGFKTLLVQAQVWGELQDPVAGMKILKNLEGELKNIPSEKIRCEFTMIEGQLQYIYSQAQVSLEKLRSAFEMARGINYQEILVDILLLLGFCYQSLKNDTLGEKFKNTARKILIAQSERLTPEVQQAYFTSKKRFA